MDLCRSRVVSAVIERDVRYLRRRVDLRRCSRGSVAAVFPGVGRGVLADSVSETSKSVLLGAKDTRRVTRD